MVVKMNNKNENFYNYMGRMFGSRIIQRQINDRIYDDNNKEWYLYIEDERVVCFVSIVKNIIKNVYTMKDSYLIETLKQIRKENKIQESIVPNVYKDLYTDAGLTLNKEDNLKNFVIVYDK